MHALIIDTILVNIIYADSRSYCWYLVRSLYNGSGSVQGGVVRDLLFSMSSPYIGVN